MRLLDLFCGAGGAAAGYHRAGFTDVVGIDHQPQPRYPFEFVQGDALWMLETLVRQGSICPTGSTRYWLKDFAAIHASPPCQRFSSLQFLNPGSRETHPDLIEPCRRLLRKTGKPWVMENVITAPMPGAVLLCGSAFGLLVRRHRLFESNVFLFGSSCRHKAQKGEYPSGGGPGLRADRRKRTSSVVSVWGGDGGGKGPKTLWEQAMGIDWMTRGELAQAIPPAYTEFVGKQLLEAVKYQKG